MGDVSGSFLVALVMDLIEWPIIGGWGKGRQESKRVGFSGQLQWVSGYSVMMVFGSPSL